MGTWQQRCALSVALFRGRSTAVETSRRRVWARPLSRSVGGGGGSLSRLRGWIPGRSRGRVTEPSGQLSRFYSSLYFSVGFFGFRAQREQDGDMQGHPGAGSGVNKIHHAVEREQSEPLPRTAGNNLSQHPAQCYPDNPNRLQSESSTWRCSQVSDRFQG